MEQSYLNGKEILSNPGPYFHSSEEVREALGKILEQKAYVLYPASTHCPSVRKAPLHVCQLLTGSSCSGRTTGNYRFYGSKQWNVGHLIGFNLFQTKPSVSILSKLRNQVLCSLLREFVFNQWLQKIVCSFVFIFSRPAGIGREVISLPVISFWWAFFATKHVI